MPPSGRKGKTRARKAPAVEAHNDASDAETPEAIPTPTRGTRKRGRATESLPVVRNIKRKLRDTRSGVEREDTEGTEAQEQSDGDTEPSTPTEQEIIQCLKVADKHVNATEDFANDLLEGQENVPGFGKIAGRDWVFIIRKIEVNIGRPETHERLAAEENGHGPMPSSRSVVDIDLGPDRQISRLHAVISYDADNLQWLIFINGRNGLRVDNNLFKRGTKTYLRNGSVIEIAGTQMAFITTPTADTDGPTWDASIIRQAQKSSEEDEDGDEDPRNTARQNGSSTSRGQLQNTSVYQSDYNGQQQGQQGQHQTSQHQQRSHPHSQRANIQTTPGTPVRSQQMFTNKSSPAANYARGVMMESTESIDYSADSAKDLKPPHSYAQMIGMAILSTSEQQMTLNNIYKWIMANYAFYRFNTGGWQNSIRHNLSLNKAFTKIARRTDEPGKGMKWMIEPSEFDNFVQQGMKGCRRPNPIPGPHSVLGSPTSPIHATRAGLKRDEEVTPPLNSYRAAYPTALEAYTPDRGPRRQTSGSIEDGIGLGINGSSIHDAELAIRTTPRNGMTEAANAAGSPPALYVSDEGRVGPLDTPFPLRPTHRLAPPSTLRRPSDFIQFSSPAPFWKMEGLMGSTPFKPLDLSPLKTPFPSLKKAGLEAKKDALLDDSQDSKGENTDDGGDDGVPKSKGSPIISSSSPPRPEGAVHAFDPPSPTMSRPASAVAKTLSQLASANREQSNSIRARTGSPIQQQTPPATAASASSQKTSAGQPIAVPQVPAPPSFDTARTTFTSFASTSQPNYDSTYTTGASAAGGFHLADEGEDEGIDLVKGFQPIGAFHQRNHLTMSIGMAGGSTYGR